MTRLPPAEAIRHYAAHGMAREVLARIYGAHHALCYEKRRADA